MGQLLFDSGIIVIKKGDFRIKVGDIQETLLNVNFGITEANVGNTVQVKAFRSTERFTGTSRNARLDADFMSQAILARPIVAGARFARIDEKFTTTIGIPDEFTVVPPLTGTFVEDLGVVLEATGDRLIRDTVNGAGKYTVDILGKYGFGGNAADQVVNISYLYDTAEGQKIVINNEVGGHEDAIFELILWGQYNCKKSTFILPTCQATTWQIIKAGEEFAVQNFGFIIYSDETGNIGQLSLAK